MDFPGWLSETDHVRAEVYALGCIYSRSILGQL